MGRFISPDWSAKAEPVPYVKLESPQTLNLYAYVGNNPLSRTDPTGHYVCSGLKDQCAAIQTGLDLAKAAQAKLGADSKGGQAIGKVLGFYGAAGEKNGVNVSFGTISPIILIPLLLTMALGFYHYAWEPMIVQMYPDRAPRWWWYPASILVELLCIWSIAFVWRNDPRPDSHIPTSL